jgi:ribosomal protein S18 acetylase RimI-like enzyme
MAIEYRFLSKRDFPQAHAAMNEAFADYLIDMSYMTPERSWRRNIKSGVDYRCSVAAFDGGRMVGVTYVGLDDWHGESAAFDAGTGIVPSHRGMGIAKGMFEHCLPGLRARGVARFLLEVLKPNQAAIRAYTKAGFEVTRELACYILPVDKIRTAKPATEPVHIREVDKTAVRKFEKHADWQPSWENSFNGMHRIEDRLVRLGAFHRGHLVGILVYYPLLNWIMSLVTDPGYRRRGIASSLLRTLPKKLSADVENIKVTNMDRSDKAILSFFENSGAHWEIDQYEMELRLQL